MTSSLSSKQRLDRMCPIGMCPIGLYVDGNPTTITATGG